MMTRTREGRENVASDSTTGDGSSTQDDAYEGDESVEQLFRRLLPSSETAVTYVPFNGKEQIAVCRPFLQIRSVSFIKLSELTFTTSFYQLTATKKLS